MKLYDLSKNRIVQFPDYIAKLKLRRKHISQGGIYCTVAEISKYVSTPPLFKVETTQPVSAEQTDYIPKPTATAFLANEDEDVPDFYATEEQNVEPVKRGRKRKPKS